MASVTMVAVVMVVATRQGGTPCPLGKAFFASVRATMGRLLLLLPALNVRTLLYHPSTLHINRIYKRQHLWYIVCIAMGAACAHPPHI